MSPSADQELQVDKTLITPIHCCITRAYKNISLYKVGEVGGHRMSWFIVIWFILFSAELFLLILEKRKVMIWSTEKHKTKENLNLLHTENVNSPSKTCQCI